MDRIGGIDMHKLSRSQDLILASRRRLIRCYDVGQENVGIYEDTPSKSGRDTQNASDNCTDNQAFHILLHHLLSAFCPYCRTKVKVPTGASLPAFWKCGAVLTVTFSRLFASGA